MQLRTILRENAVSRSIVKRSIARSLRSAWSVVKFFIDPRFRSEKMTAWRFGGAFHQRSTQTGMNRYPVLFNECRNYLSRKKAPHILSFGCSTGEEVFTLGKYMQHADITGVDINPWCIRKCKEADEQHRYVFLHRQSEEFMAAKDFDAIFCLAVFQRTENRSGVENSNGYTFEMFERELLMLDAKLNKGGLLVINNCDFNFAETILSVNYSPHVFEGSQRLTQRPLFDRNNRKIADEQSLNRIFIKQA